MLAGKSNYCEGTCDTGDMNIYSLDKYSWSLALTMFDNTQFFFFFGVLFNAKGKSTRDETFFAQAPEN